MALATKRPALVWLRQTGTLVRHFSDDALTNLQRTHIAINDGGRQSTSGITATIFGATGFVGGHVVQKLGRVGSECIIPYRGDGLNTRRLKVMGDLGKIVPLPVDFTQEETLVPTLKRSNVVINLVGGLGETRNYSYHDTNVKLVHRICKAAAAMPDVKRFIHISALGADLKSPSALLRAKAEGELVVRDFFPDATILRPAPIFGEEDKLLNHLAYYVNFSFWIPLLGNGKQLLQPVYATDVALAVVAACVDSDAPGRTYELGGPQVLSKKQLMTWVVDHMKLLTNDVILTDTNLTICRLFAKAMSFAPNRQLRTMTVDQVDQSLVDLVVSKDAYKIEDLGIKPLSLETIGPSVLMVHNYRRDLRIWDLPKGDPRESRLHAV